MKTWWMDHNGMHQSLEAAKSWIPKAEWEDIRCYVEVSVFEKTKQALDLAVGRLEHILSEGYGNDFDKKALDKIRKLSND